MITSDLTLLKDGLITMCLGMGVVFVFLTILIYAMDIMSKVVGYLNEIFPEVVAAPAKSKKTNTAKEDEQIAVAIAAAVART